MGNAKTSAWGLRVPKACSRLSDLKAIRESGGTAIAVSEKEIAEASQRFAQKEGLFVAPEAAAGLAGIRQLLKSASCRRRRDCYTDKYGLR